MTDVAGVNMNAIPLTSSPDAGALAVGKATSHIHGGLASVRELSPRDERSAARDSRDRRTPDAVCGFTEEAFQALCRQIDEPSWLRERRRDAWKHFQESGPLALPTDRSQKTLQPLQPETISPVCPPPADQDAERASTAPGLEEVDWGDLAGSCITSDGVDSRVTTCTEWREKGVILTDLATAARQFPDLVQDHFPAPVTEPARLQLSALHEALRTGGLFLYVPRGVEVPFPILLGRRLTRGGLASFPYTLIVAGQDSRVSVIEDSVGSDQSQVSLCNGIVDIHLQAGARLNYYHLQHWGRHVYQYMQQRAHLDRDASITLFTALTGGQLSYTYAETNLKGQGSQGTVLGLVYGTRNQSFLSRTVQNHSGPHTTSDLLVKAVLQGEAHSDYSGWITIEKQAVKADAYQLQRNLLVSPKARADSIPNLEILANDVRCSHGAAVGSVDEEQLYYLRSRGLSRGQAEQMVVEGFAEQVIARIPEPALQERIRRLLQARLGFSREED